MPYMKKLQLFFVIVVVFSSILFIQSWYSFYKFKNNDLSEEIFNKIHNKENQILNKIYNQYHINAKVKIQISKKMGNKLYGLTSLDKYNNITIFLNKNMFYESLDYMIDNVILHEYAHAMMFKFGYVQQNNGGHTQKWVDICKKIGGIKCQRYVNSNDILTDKIDIMK